MQNLSHNELEQIRKMLNLCRNELDQIVKMRCIKNYKNMSQEGLLIALLKSGCSFADLRKSNSDNAETEKTIKNFNELRDKLSRLEIKKIRKKIYKIENNENFSILEKEKIEQYFTELEKSLHKVKKYYDYDDPDYKGIREKIYLVK